MSQYRDNLNSLFFILIKFNERECKSMNIETNGHELLHIRNVVTCARRKKIQRNPNVISQLFMGWKFDFGKDGLSMLRAHAHSIYRNTCVLSEQEETKCHLVDDNTNDQELDMDEIPIVERGKNY